MAFKRKKKTFWQDWGGHIMVTAVAAVIFTGGIAYLGDIKLDFWESGEMEDPELELGEYIMDRSRQIKTRMLNHQRTMARHRKDLLKNPSLKRKIRGVERALAKHYVRYKDDLSDSRDVFEDLHSKHMKVRVLEAMKRKSDSAFGKIDKAYQKSRRLIASL